MTDPPAASTPLTEPSVPRGRTPALDPDEHQRVFREAVGLFNGVRYWYAHEAWETLWRAAPEEDRDFYQGLIQLAAGLLHLQRRNMRGARNKLREGLEKLRRYEPAYHGIFISELMGEASRLLGDLDGGHLPYLIPPVIRFTETPTADFSR